MTLYLKYRPQKIADLDLTSVREALSKIVASGKIPHAFLFAGTRGTGKTSSARILAKIINCENLKDFEPCGECEQCISIGKGTNIDVIEMDAASNRGIDDVRILRENVKLAPVRAKKKIYIIDEAHMLTSEAANALLKTLEEPPSHVVFILATTNAEKLPVTIHSRLTVIHFHPATKEETIRSLMRVIEGEKLQVEEGALDIIVRASDGSFRDGVKTLEQLSLQMEKITLKDVEDYLFAGSIAVEPLFTFLAQKDATKALEEIERVAKSGAVGLYIKEVQSRLHSALLAKNGIKGAYDLNGFTKQEIILLLEQIARSSQLAFSGIPQIALEIAITRFLDGKARPLVEEVKQQEAVVVEKKTSTDGEIDKDVWVKILGQLRQKNASIEALLRAARPVGFDGKKLTLAVYYKFHKERLEVGTNRRTLEEVLAHVYGNPVHVDCLLTERPAMAVKPKEPILTEPKEADIIRAAKEIFSS